MGMVVRNAASSVKNAAGSALHVFSGDSKRGNCFILYVQN